jgi:Rha family phage regulatory protein
MVIFRTLFDRPAAPPQDIEDEDAVPILANVLMKEQRDMDKLPPIHKLVTICDGRPVTDSITMARTFGKRHTTVLRSCDNLTCSREFIRLNFVVTYTAEKVAPRRYVSMTADGLSMLVSGFTGKNAMACMEAYIEAFNAVAAYISNQDKYSSKQHLTLLANKSDAKARTPFVAQLQLKPEKDIPSVNAEHSLIKVKNQHPCPLVKDELSTFLWGYHRRHAHHARQSYRHRTLSPNRRWAKHAAQGAPQPASSFRRTVRAYRIRLR